MATNASQSPEDFNERGEGRDEIIRRIQDTLAFDSVNRYFWAACQLGDLESMKKMVARFELGKRQVNWQTDLYSHFAQFWVRTGSTASIVGSAGTTGSYKSPEDAGSDPERPAKRQKIDCSKTVRAHAISRDDHRCVLTGLGPVAVDVCHIFPFRSLCGTGDDEFTSRTKFWDLLRDFWPSHKIEALTSKIFPHGNEEPGLESAENLITLAQHAHTMWDKGIFALKPISLSEDKKVLKVQFFWQPELVPAPRVRIQDKPPSSRNLDCIGDAFLDTRDHAAIVSGQEFEIKMADPDTHPLPSFELLELQFFLQRVVRMAGGAEPNGDSDEDSDENSDEDSDCRGRP